MRKLIIAIIVATSLLAFARKPQTIEELKVRLQSADSKKQVELYMDIAKLQIDAADEAYNSNIDHAKQLLEDGIQSAEQAGQGALETGKHMKKTEIGLRKLEKRLEDIRRSWSVEDREPIQPGIKRIESARSKLLDRMFRK